MKWAARVGVLLWAVAWAGGAAMAEDSGRAMKQTVPLASGWEFRQVTEGANAQAAEWRPATVPGDVHLDLLKNNLIPQPFYRDNEAKLQWIENASWEYRTTLQATPELMRREHVDLVFDGLDSQAKVFLNDQPVLTASDAFLQYRQDVKALLKPGANTLHIVFESPIRTAERVAMQDPWFEKTGVDARTYLRKPAYEYGWDWGPRFVTSGIWRPARLEAWDGARIERVFLKQQDVSSSVAHVQAEVDVVASAPGPATVSVEAQPPGGGHALKASQKVDLAAGLNHVDLPLEIANPQLWYPAGYGGQPIYTFAAKLAGKGGTEDAATARTGLRSIVLRREKDQWGRSFEFLVNGIPVYAKGADVIPFDSFPSRVTEADYRRILQSARDANMNMIRHWGGGYYETDEFYDICDELGIMVWQDFMFGNDWQPGTYAFRQQVAQEAAYQVERLRNHPSIVIWCGNNETEEAFHWKSRDQLPADVRMRMWQDYLLLFSGVLPQVVAQYDPATPYWPSSPSSDYEDLAPGQTSGDMHDWSVWHGRVPFETYEEHFPRFMTEYGFQSFPEMKTIDEFTAPEDRTSIFTPVMLAHQKNNEGNSIIQDYMLKYYAEPKDFADFLYASQVLQAEGIKIGAEHLRRLRPRNMGGIYWQLNDCWPVASWSSIDYYGRWKALQFYARRFYSPVLVSPHVENGALAVYVVSDRTTPFDADLRLRVMTLDGKSVLEKTQRVHVDPLSSKVELNLPLSEFAESNGRDPAQMFAAADLSEGGQALSSNLVYLVPTKQVHLPQVTVESHLTRQGGGYQLRLSAPVLARDVYVSFGDADARLSDNYVNLLPNEPVELTVTSTAGLDELQSKMKVISLVDAFSGQSAPPAPAHP